MPVISRRNTMNIWRELKEIHKASSEAIIDSYIVQYQNQRMESSEKAMKYVNLITEVENKLMAVGHALSASEKKRVLLRVLCGEFAVISGMIRATEKSLQESIEILVIQEAESVTPESN